MEGIAVLLHLLLEVYVCHIYPGLPPYEKHGKHRKSNLVIHENIKAVKSVIEVYGNMQVIKRP